MPISFSPDGTWLLIGKSGSEPSWLTFSEYFLFNIKNPTTLVPISTPGTYINSLEWSPDSQSIAITSSPIEESTDWIHGITGRSLSILSLKTNQLTKITENVISYSWNPQGKQIAYTQGFDTLPQEFTFFMPLNIVNMDSATVEKPFLLVSKKAETLPSA